LEITQVNLVGGKKLGL